MDAVAGGAAPYPCRTLAALLAGHKSASRPIFPVSRSSKLIEHAINKNSKPKSDAKG